MLLDSDIAYLDEKRWRYTLHDQGATTLLVIHGFELPLGFTAARVELLIEIPITYPDAKLDMFWLYPWVKLTATQQEPQAANVPREFEGKTWQRFSRHLNTWRPESDSLQTYLVWVRRHLEHDARIAA